MAAVESIFQRSEGAQVVEVTPEIARRLIENSNRGNRKVKPSVVKKYAKIMRAGQWKFSPETISVSNTGRLLNGQHRMLAVMESGVSCRFLFATGFDDEVFDVLDRGATRSRADALAMDKKVVECAGVLCRLGLGDSPSAVTDFEVEHAAKRIGGAHGEIMERCSALAKVFSAAPFRLAAAARIMNGDDKEYVLGMYEGLVMAKMDMLPPVGHAAVRAILTGRFQSISGSYVQPTNCCTAWDIFNPKSEGKSRIIVQFNRRAAAEIVGATGCEWS